MRATQTVVFACGFGGILAGVGCGPDAGLQRGERYPGGDTTNTFLLGTNAFILPAENIEVENEPSFYTGNSFFNQAWVETPSSTVKRDGLGPMFNARSCAACHFKDGRGRPPRDDDETFLGLLLRVSIPGTTVHGAPKPDANYGDQIQPFSTLGLLPEANPRVDYQEVHGVYEDGEPYTLLQPTYSLEALNYGPLHAEAMMSPRIASAVIGLGLLEAIPESRILELEDSTDRNEDGISGRVNWVQDTGTSELAIGRFGWKATQPNIRQQTGAAFIGDIGISSPIFPDQLCAENQRECQEEPHGGQPEIEQDLFEKVVLYTSLLAVPMRRFPEDPEVKQGKKLFNKAGCVACHTPSHITGVHPEFAELSEQIIWPYTDLLLHDMGEDLSDGRPDFEATGREWRTSPLWGVGLIPSVNNHHRLLHDGRARGVAEAILWHGGEGFASREAFRSMDASSRDQLIQFVESL